MKPHSYLWILLFPLVLAIGCGDGRPRAYPVSGKVVFEDGEIVQFGDVEFFNEEFKMNANGKIAKDGTFKLTTYGDDDGAITGNHKVVIIQRTRNHMTAQIEGMINHDHGDLIDRKYFDYRTSKLTAEIQPIELNEIELTVKRMPAKEQAAADH